MDQQGKRGFAAMDREKQREIASKGGRASHVKGTAHEFTADEAREAGRKGGEVVSGNRQHMSEIGRRGGEISGTRRAKHAQTPGTQGAHNQAVPLTPAMQQPEPNAQPDHGDDESSPPESSAPESAASDTQAQVHEEAHSK